MNLRVKAQLRIKKRLLVRYKRVFVATIQTIIVLI